MKCQVCNVDAARGALFCPQCGAKLPRAEAAEGASSASVARAESSGAPKQAAAASSDVSSFGGRRRAADVPEETLWEGSYSPKAMLGAFVGGAVATVALLVVFVLIHHSAWWIAPLIAIVLLWIALVGRLAMRRLGVHYKLTNHMFYHQTGVLTRVTNRIEVIDIDDVTFSQSLFDRMVNIGKIKVVSSDRTDPVFWLLGIENVEQVAQTVDKARRAERIRRGMSIESLSGVPGAPDGLS